MIERKVIQKKIMKRLNSEPSMHFSQSFNSKVLHLIKDHPVKLFWKA